MDHDQWLESGPGWPEDSDCVGTCPTCRGKGEILDNDFMFGDFEVVDCPDCKGTGVICG